MRGTKICRYIDDPPSFLFWDIDEIGIFAAFLSIGIVTEALGPLFLLGISASFFFKKMKQTRSDGFLLHFLYWYGFFQMRRCPPSWMRYFTE